MLSSNLLDDIPMIKPDSIFTEKDVALANFAKALALPVRVCIIRTIIENGNEVSRDRLLEIPYDWQTINQHLLNLKTMEILKLTVRKRVSYFSVNEELFVTMSNGMLDLFENVNKFVEPALQIVRTPLLHREKVEIETEPTEIKTERFGVYIKKKRKLIKMSQEDCAKQLDVERYYISKIETGAKILKAEKLKKLAEILQLNLNELTDLYQNDLILDNKKKNK